MVEISEIEDRETLEAWLEGQPREVSEWIASRSAARVLPIWWDAVKNTDWVSDFDFIASPILRSLLTSSVAFLQPTEDMQTASRSAAAAASAASSAAGDAAEDISRDASYNSTLAYVTRSAASAAVRASAAAHSSSAAHSSALAAFATASAARIAAADAARDVDSNLASVYSTSSEAAAASRHAAFWGVVRADAQVFAQSTGIAHPPLWQTDPDPHIAELWERLKHSLPQDPTAEKDWSFWITWYQSLLDGTPMLGDRDLTNKMFVEIALDKTINWEDEAKALRQINAIWQSYLVDQAIAQHPLGEGIARDERSGRLHSYVLEARDLEQVVKDIRTALREFLARCKKSSGNLSLVMLAAIKPLVDELRRDLSKHKNNPRELFRKLEETRTHMAAVAKQEAFLDDPSLGRLLGNLQQRGVDICTASPEVMAEVEQRLKTSTRLFTAQQRMQIISMASGMMLDSEGLLEMAVARAVLIIADDTSSDEIKSAAWTYLLGSIPRGAKLLHEVGEQGSAAKNETDLVKKIEKTADLAIKGDKVVDVAQEAVAESGPWVTEAFTQIISGNLWGLGG